jgi:hypothetical protein
LGDDAEAAGVGVAVETYKDVIEERRAGRGGDLRAEGSDNPPRLALSGAQEARGDLAHSKRLQLDVDWVEAEAEI